MGKQALDLDNLLPEIQLLDRDETRLLVQRMWTDLWNQSEWTDINDVPVSLKIDYPQVLHCRGIANAALAAATAFEQVHKISFDREVLLAGALLMDVGKLVETMPGSDGKATKSRIGELLPHSLYSAHLALSYGAPLEVVHILTCHSPNAGKAPETLECKLLDWLDQADISVFGWEIWKRQVMHFQP